MLGSTLGCRIACLQEKEAVHGVPLLFLFYVHTLKRIERFWIRGDAKFLEGAVVDLP